METLEKIVSQFASFVWGPWLIILLFGTHLFLTFRLGFIQRFIGRMIKTSVAKDKDAPGDVSQFGALMTALAATIGTGNIYGVAGAVAVGGPGAVLWMWLTGVFGIATKYSEALLSVKYRVTNPDGTMAGGPMYVLERALKAKWLGILFAIFAAIAAFGIGNMVQSNTLADLASNYQIPKWLTGAILTAITAAVVLGGVKRIAIACELIVPLMAVIYVLGCIVILVMRAPQIPSTIALICENAFTGTAAVGGFLGATLRQAIQAGIARGLFSNESGLGSAPIVAAAARTKNPVRQAMVSATGTFWDTVVVCAMTGLVVVSSGDWQSPVTHEDNAGKNLAVLAFDDIPYIGPYILSFGMLFFVFSTILGWSYYGERAAEYLFGQRVILPYRVLWVIAVYVGATVTAKIVWNFADALNGLMAVPNLIALLLLNRVIVAETKAHRHEFTGEPEPADRA